MARGVDPLRLLIIVALTAAVGVKLTYWLAGDGRARDERSTGGASITGTVLDDAGVPVAEARVVASNRQAPFTTTARTDAGGRFSLIGLPDGTYRLIAEKAGYLGDRGNSLPRLRFEPPGRTVDVDGGESAAGVAVTIVRGAAVAGIVYDEDGTPAARRYVRVLSRDPRFADASWRDAAPVGATDEQGRFRVGGLAPGEYYIMAGLTANGERRVYYPDAPRVNDAAPITLGTGEARTDLELRARPVATSIVSGRVTRADGARLPNVRIDLVSRDGYEPDDRRRHVMSAADGTFAFTAVQPDDYLLIAHTQAAEGWPSVRRGTHVWASAPVTSDGREPRAVALVVHPGQMLSGRVEFAPLAGAKPVALEWTPIWLGAADAATQALLQSGSRIEAPLDANGTFTFAGVPPGRYRVTGRYVDEPWLVSSVTAGNLDLLDSTLEILPAVAPPSLTISLTDLAAEISGTLRDAAGRPVADRLVVVFGADETHWTLQSRRTQVAMTDPNGRFGANRLPAGEYLLAVRPAGSAASHKRLAFEELAPRAARVALTRGERRTLDLTVER